MLSVQQTDTNLPLKSTMEISDLYATAIVESDGTLLYADRGFKKLAKGDTQTLFKNIVQLKKRLSEEDFEIILPTKPTKKDTLDVKTYNNLKSGLSSQTIFTKFDKFDKTEIKNINELITNVFESIQEGQFVDGITLTFDAKYKETNLIHRNFEVTVSRLGLENKVVLNFHDITEYGKQLAIEARSQAGQFFMSILSNELRKPLKTNIDLLEACLSNNRISQSVKEQFLAPAFKNGVLLKYMINTALDYSAIAARKFSLRYQNLSLRDTLKDCYQLLQDVSENKKLEYSLHIDDNIPKIFGTDHERVKEIVLHLLNNALGSTPRGSVKINAEQVTKRQVRVSIQDTGLGIRPEVLAKLQYSLETAKPEAEISELGSKFSLANQLARILGPDDGLGIKVTSKHVEGSTFSFVLEDKNQLDSGVLRDTDYSIVEENITVQETEWNNIYFKDKQSVFTVL